MTKRERSILFWWEDPHSTPPRGKGKGKGTGKGKLAGSFSDPEGIGPMGRGLCLWFVVRDLIGCPGWEGSDSTEELGMPARTVRFRHFPHGFGKVSG